MIRLAQTKGLTAPVPSAIVVHTNYVPAYQYQLQELLRITGAKCQ
jgi:hypothetical protein